MFKRDIEIELEQWVQKESRKPLVLRGARQVGKTTAIHQFGEKFDTYLYFNLELEEERAIFDKFTGIEELIQALFFYKGKENIKSKKRLIFIDEIQESAQALQMLRYFYEKHSDIHVVAAGSMLETVFDNELSFPVGRVEYMVLRPVSFPEFLRAMSEDIALEQLTSVPVAAFAHSKLIKLFHTYCLIGGMPEIINKYISTKDIISLSTIFESLLVSYADDVEKYASGNTQINIIRHAIRSAFAEAGKRIKFHGFGNSNYGSREMGEALRALEKAFLIKLIYPATSYLLPLLPDLRKSPRLQVLDTGLLNYFAGIQKEIIGTSDLQNVYKGLIIEHIIGQQLLAINYSALNTLSFWVKEKKSSTAEVDYLFPYEGKLIPLEVKSGSTGKLKSLQQFMEGTNHTLAVRFYSGELNRTKVKTTSGKEYDLLNLPYYLASQLENYLDWFSGTVNK